MIADFKRIYRQLSRFSSLVCAAILLIVAVSGCAGRSQSSGHEAETADRQEMLVYCLSQDRTSVRTIPYETEAASQTPLAAAEEMLDCLAAPQAKGSGCTTPIEGFTVRSLSLQDGDLVMDLSEEYLELPAARAVMARAAMVCSLCQIEGIDSVSFRCKDTTLTDRDGVRLEKMTPEMFIINTGNEIENYERVRLHLYFANAEGNRLLDTYRTVVYNSNVSMERLVVEQVLKGPNSDAVRPTLHPETKLLSVTARDGVCYVNLDRTFLMEPYDVTPQVAVYSLVNSLTELSSVQKVQISVDGETDISFMETMKLRTLYERNPSIIQDGSEDKQ